MRPTLWPYVLIVLVFLSCSSRETKPERPKVDPLSNSSVNLENDFDLSSSKKPELERKASQGLYGPVPGENVDDFVFATNQTKLVPVTALYLGPGLMRATLHVNVLKALNYHGIQTHIISGMGLGAALATMYAFGLTPDLIEWRVFRFTNAVEDLRPLSDQWVAHLEDILLEGLLEKRIEQANLTLALPVFDQKLSKIVLLTRGRVKQLIRKQFEFSPGAASGRYLSAMLGRDKMGPLLNEQGADLNFGVVAMGEKLSFENGDNYLAGIYGRLIGTRDGENKDFDKVLFLPTSKMSIDSAKNVDKEIEKSLKTVTEQLALFKTLIKQWKFNKRDSGVGERGPRVFDQHFLIREND